MEERGVIMAIKMNETSDFLLSNLFLLLYCLAYFSFITTILLSFHLHGHFGGLIRLLHFDWD